MVLKVYSKYLPPIETYLCYDCRNQCKMKIYSKANFLNQSLS